MVRSELCDACRHIQLTGATTPQLSANLSWQQQDIHTQYTQLAAEILTAIIKLRWAACHVGTHANCLLLSGQKV